MEILALLVLLVLPIQGEVVPSPTERATQAGDAASDTMKRNQLLTKKRR